MRRAATVLFAALAALAAVAQNPPADPVREAFQKCDVPALRKLAEGGDLRATKTLVLVYEGGSCGLRANLAESFRWEKAAAALGDAESAAHVGFAYLSGDGEHGVASDLREAVKWLRAAGEAGDSRACGALGELYMEGGPGLAPAPMEGARWRALARDAAEMERAIKRARRYSIGYERGPKDIAEGLERISKSASKGTPEDLYCLGLFYIHGPMGFPKEPAVGMSKVTLAAEKGDGDALLYLGLVYRYGIGAPKDPAKARSWLKKAADAGNPRAQAWLGEMLLDGEGGEPDFVAAEPLLVSAYKLREPVAGLLNRVNLEKAYLAAKKPERKPPIADILWPVVRDRGATAAEALYRELLKGQPDGYDFSEAWLNYLGYRLLDARRYHDAVAIFRLNAAGFPKSSNVWDSLGEAQALLGLTDEAIANYKKSLALDPGNQGAAKQIEKLERAKAAAAAPTTDSHWEEDMKLLFGDEPPEKEASKPPPPPKK